MRSKLCSVDTCFPPKTPQRDVTMKNDSETQHDRNCSNTGRQAARMWKMGQAKGQRIRQDVDRQAVSQAESRASGREEYSKGKVRQ